jgi:hypothetical protein
LSDFFIQSEELSRTIFTIIHDDLVESIVAATEQIVGDLNMRGSGILIVLPTDSVYGLIEYAYCLIMKCYFRGNVASKRNVTQNKVWFSRVVESSCSLGRQGNAGERPERRSGWLYNWAGREFFCPFFLPSW